MKKTVAERLKEKLAKPNQYGCVEWTGTVNAGGQGVMWADGKLRQVRRIAYELAHGPITGKKFVLPECQNVLCCNPDHLYLARMANTAGMASQGFQNMQFPPRATDEIITSSDGTTKTLDEWLADPRVKASRATIKTRLSMMRRRDETAAKWGEETAGPQHWDIDRCLFEPPHKRTSATYFKYSTN